MIEKYTLLQKCSTSRGALRINCTHKMDRKKKKNPRNRTKAVSEKDGGTQRFVQAAFRKPIKLDRLQFRIHKNRQPPKILSL